MLFHSTFHDREIDKGTPWLEVWVSLFPRISLCPVDKRFAHVSMNINFTDRTREKMFHIIARAPVADADISLIKAFEKLVGLGLYA